jgi:lysophospholipase L1-like esterase
MQPVSLRWIAPLLILLTLRVCAAPLVQPGDRIAIFGDSISTGKGYGYKAVELLKAAHPDWGLTWQDNGHPGWRSDHAQKALDQLVAGKPTLVTIMFGTNDVGQTGARGIAALGANLRVLVEGVRASGARVVLLTPPYTSDESAWGAYLNRTALPQMAEEVFALGKTLKVPVCDMFTAMRLANDAGRKADQKFQMFSAPGDVHPNDLGHTLMARALADFLLGTAVPPRVPFVWKHPNSPVGEAEAVTAVDLTAAGPLFPSAVPMMLTEKRQTLFTNRWKSPADLSARGTAGWDAKHLFIEIEVTDDVVIAGDKQPAWGADGIEFFVDTRPFAQRTPGAAVGYFQFLVPVMPADGAAPVACGNQTPFDASTVQAASWRTKGGYRLRFALPWASLGFTPAAGGNIGFDFAINDTDDAKTERYKALWRGAGDDYNEGGSLGTLVLSPRTRLVPATDTKLRYTGRIDTADPAAPRFFWPGTSVALRFTGTSFGLRLDDARGQNYYTVIIDGDDAHPCIIPCRKGEARYPVAVGLTLGTHTAVIVRRTETDGGPTRFLGVYVDAGKGLAKPPKRPARRIEFYGDSITSALGNESTDGKVTAAFSNNYYSYAAFTARAMGAEYHCISKSGLGVTTTHGTDLTKGIVTTLYDRLDPDGGPAWDFARWTPDAVVINLGENDQFIYRMGKHPDPGPAAVTRLYADFVKTIRARYPRAAIFCVLGPMHAVHTDLPKYEADAVRSLNAAGDACVYYLTLDTHGDSETFSGGSNHPGVAEQRAMAERLAPFIKEKMRW